MSCVAPFSRIRWYVICQRASYSSSVQSACPHQNQLPVCSCHGRNITGTFTPSSVFIELRKSATRSNQTMNFAWFAPPGSTERTTLESETSHASLPVSGLSACQLNDTMPPLSYCATLSRRILSNGTPSRLLSCPSSKWPRSNDITAG